MKLKTFITAVITLLFGFSFVYVVIKFCDRDMANIIIPAFITVATNVMGVYIGYQTNKIGGK